MSKITVAVLFGGCSSEHVVSLRSAAAVIRNIPREKYDLRLLGITRQGKWLLYEGGPDAIENGDWERDSRNRRAFLTPDRSVYALMVQQGDGFAALPVDVVFPILHGKNGEDGTMQGLLELCGIPYVGCGTLASAVCMDKAVANILLASAGITKAQFLWFFAREYNSIKEQVRQEITQRLGDYPVFVKPANAGSSVGISKVKSEAELDEAIARAAKEDQKIVIEETICGKEVECAVLGSGRPLVSVVGEIAPSAEFYDYADKYDNGTSQVYIPAPLNEETSEQIRQVAAQAYRVLGCEGLARVDFFVHEHDGAALLNEVNTMPGFTSISMYPMLWEACGMDFAHLLDNLITLALEKPQTHATFK